MPRDDIPSDAPHTALDLVDEEWKRPYLRAVGCYPKGLNGHKYWCPVNRIDNAYGDRHLICSARNQPTTATSLNKVSSS